MEHFFNRKPTKGYIELSKEIEKNTNNRHISDEHITVPNHISKAACYVEDARDGRLANGKGKMSEKSRKIQLCFFIQTHAWWGRFIYLSIAFMAILIFFEPPSSAAITVCNERIFNFGTGKEICKNDEIIREWEAWTLFVEFLLIMIFVTDIFMKATYMKPSVYFTKKWHKVSAFFILLFSIDWIIFTCTYYALESKGLRFSRPFRPVLLLTRYRELRRILETLTDMMNQLIKLTSVILVFVLMFAWAGVTLFGKTYTFTKECVDHSYDKVADGLLKDPDYCVEHICWDTIKYPFCVCTSAENATNVTKTGCDDTSKKFSDNYLSEEFTTFNNSFDNPLMGVVRLVVLISTENYPDVMLPAYKTSRVYLLYFMFFIFIGMFLLLSVLLAVIVEFWLSYLKKTNDSEKRKERLGITKAFIWIDKDRNYYIKEHSWNELILLLKKDFTKLQSHFMFQMLDWEQKGQLDVLDFLNITEALKLHYTLKDADTAIENTEIGQFARRVLSYYFTISFCGFMEPINVDVKKISLVFSVIHTFLAVIITKNISEVYIISHTAINTILLLVLLSEVLLRVMAHGSGYFHPLINKWEVFTIVIAFFAMIGYWITWLSSLKASTGNINEIHRTTTPTTDEIFRIVWELAIFMRMALQKASIRGQLVFFYKVLAVLIELFLFIIIIVYVFLGIGLELFAIASGGADENYFQAYDCSLGFKSASCGFQTLWQMITSSNWHEIMNSVAEATGPWAYVYFIIYYLCINIVLLDVTIAIAIEMYNAVKSQCFDSKDSSSDEGVIFALNDNQETSVPRRPTIFNTTSRSKLLNTQNEQTPEIRKLKPQLQIRRNTSGSWRHGIINSNIFQIPSKDLDGLQKFLEKEKCGTGSYEGQNYLNMKENGIELKVLSNEKTNEMKILKTPECIMYFAAPVNNKDGERVGEFLMEFHDNHPNSVFKINFDAGADMAPTSGRVFSLNHEGEEKVYIDNLRFTSSEELENSDFEWHVTQSWTMKRLHKLGFRQEKVQVVIETEEKTVKEEEESEGKKCVLTADLTGYKKEKKLWDEKLAETGRIRIFFESISPLLHSNAHRISMTVKQDVEPAPDPEKGEEERVEKKALDRLDRLNANRKVYHLEDKDDTDTKCENTAHERWKRAICIVPKRSIRVAADPIVNRAVDAFRRGSAANLGLPGSAKSPVKFTNLLALGERLTRSKNKIDEDEEETESDSDSDSESESDSDSYSGMSDMDTDSSVEPPKSSRSRSGSIFDVKRFLSDKVKKISTGSRESRASRESHSRASGDSHSPDARSDSDPLGQDRPRMMSLTIPGQEPGSSSRTPSPASFRSSPGPQPDTDKSVDENDNLLHKKSAPPSPKMTRLYNKLKRTLSSPRESQRPTLGPSTGDVELQDVNRESGEEPTSPAVICSVIVTDHDNPDAETVLSGGDPATAVSTPDLLAATAAPALAPKAPLTISVSAPTPTQSPDPKRKPKKPKKDKT